MRRRTPPASKPDPATVEAALAELGAGELRGVILDLLSDLDDQAYGRAVSGLVDRAVRRGSGWSPPVPPGEGVARIIAFAEAARRIGLADPSDIDDGLRQGSNAFLARDYRTAIEIFRALLPPIAGGEIDLGQHELADEVLGVDVATCGVQYVVSVYMTTDSAHRAAAVRSAIDESDAIGGFQQPLREMERVAVEPLPGMEAFLPQWRALLEGISGRGRRGGWETGDDVWLREVVRRLEGIEGLARIARSGKHASDLRAWCDALVETKSWTAALAAYQEAASTVRPRAIERGEFLDGAALCAQELGRKDLPAFLERAWREAPGMLRLLRWLGSARSAAVLKKRAAGALEACPKNATRQRALLHVLLGDFESPAKLLAAAPGLGWSASEHPGHLLFPIFQAVLAGKPPSLPQLAEPYASDSLDTDDLEWLMEEPVGPRLATPEIDEIFALAAIDTPVNAAVRPTMLRAMRTAAEKRVAAIVENKRRRHYGHAARLVTACAALDPTPETKAWMADIRAAYRRYPALQSEFEALSGRQAHQG